MPARSSPVSVAVSGSNHACEAPRHQNGPRTVDPAAASSYEEDKCAPHPSDSKQHVPEPENPTQVRNSGIEHMKNHVSELTSAAPETPVFSEKDDIQTDNKDMGVNHTCELTPTASWSSCKGGSIRDHESPSDSDAVVSTFIDTASKHDRDFDPAAVTETSFITRLESEIQELQQEQDRLSSILFNPTLKQLQEDLNVKINRNKNAKVKLKTFEQKRREITKIIKEIKEEQTRYRSDEIEAERAVLKEKEFRDGLCLDRSRVVREIDEAEARLVKARQWQQLKSEFPDDSLRELAAKIRGISPSEDGPRLKSDDTEIGHDPSADEDNLERWHDFKVENATVNDFIDLSADFYKIDHKVKHELTPPLITPRIHSTAATDRKPGNMDYRAKENVKRESSSHEADPGTQPEARNDDKVSMTSDALRHHLEEMKYHATRAGLMISAIQGVDSKKRRNLNPGLEESKPNSDNVVSSSLPSTKALSTKQAKKRKRTFTRS